RDDGVRAGETGNRDDAVERLDEVRDDALVREANSAVEPLDLGRDVPARQVVILREDGERLDHLVRMRNSLRSDSSSSYSPRQTVVPVREPPSSAPRIAVQRCAASPLPATPRAPVSSCSPPAISSASRSCTVKRRA